MFLLSKSADATEAKPVLPMRRERLWAYRARNALAMVAFLWIGVICAISLEARIKFNAPSLTFPVGLDVGRYVFDASQKAQIALALWGTGAACLCGLRRKGWALWMMALLALALQAFWLYPLMDARVTRILAGETVPPNWYHLVYVGLEGVKILTLLLMGLGLLPRAYPISEAALATTPAASSGE